ncbi:hypothetical protein DIS24_g9924 [Lasiodiplodia hormozganensis]|uniref:Heterokaryon incompatibility domain-containing protein n=1 Tax=Lasiodiplodia hormozganensis TaxID=869390 RepID=A0AA39XQG5_9PEZI|nr:hypothetical protein DIS24_g9924 [Lasiodiplodia hormozganensis]
MRTFLNDRRLDIYEYPSGLSCSAYVAISYVWKGNPLVADPSSPSYWVEELGTFSVKGAESGDPISLDVLYHTCSAALSCRYSGSYLWLDRLCIVQTSELDRAWQIRQMYDIYKRCKICCVLPGGIQRLVSLDEETTWIERAWTLQEVVAPYRSIVLFLADEDQLEQLDLVRKRAIEPSCITEIFSGLSAYGELRPLLKLALASNDSPINVFGRKRAPIAALYGATVLQVSHAYFEKDIKEQMIWRCALMRTSSRPVDMVFSIMGLLSVDLDPLQFDKGDRLKATIALASKKISYLGSKASWLTAAYQLEPCRQISSFPLLPETSVDGKAIYINAESSGCCLPSTVSGRLVADVVDELCDVNHYLIGLPEGTMDESGYLTFCGKAVSLVPVTVDVAAPLARPADDTYSSRAVGNAEDVCVSAADGSMWQECDDSMRAATSSIPSTIAVFLGKQASIGAMVELDTPDSDSEDDSLNWRERFGRWRLPEIALLIREHEPGKFHRVSYLKLPGGFSETFKAPRDMTISVGGPYRMASG